MTRTVICNLAAAVGLAATSTATGAMAQTTDISLRLPWLLNVQAAGYVMAAEKGFYEDAGLNVEILPGGPNLNSTALVASGANTFGTNDVNGIILSQNQGMDLVMVAACFQRHPGGVISLAKDNINEPKDLVGKKLAYNEGGPWTLTQAMLARAGVSLDDIDLIVSPSTELLINGNVDAKTGFTVNEPIAVELAGLPTSVMLPSDFGIETYAEVVFTTRDFADKNPDIVSGFVEATIKGYEYAYEHPEETVETILGINNQLDPAQQTAQLARQKNYVFTGAPVCNLDGVVVKSTMDVLVEFAGLKTDLDPEMLYTTEFLPKP